jgi:hypothetical protein
LTPEDAIFVDYTALMKDGGETPSIDPYIAGVYAGDGCLRYGNGRELYKGVPVAIVFPLKAEKWREVNLRVLRHYGEFASLNAKAVNVYSLGLADEMRKFVKAEVISDNGRRSASKVLALDIANVDRKWLTEYLSGLIDTDGYVVNRNGSTLAGVSTTSFEQAVQIQAIAIRLGLHAKVAVTDDCPSRKGHDWSTAFNVELRFPKVFNCSSIKLKSVKLLTCVHKLGTAIRGWDTVELVRKLEQWDGYVYDVKTSTGEYMAGCIQNHNSFHSGGTLGSGDSLTQGFQRLQELLHAPETIREQGTLADKDGRITRIYDAPQGGEYVEIDGHQQYVSAGRKVIVKVGDKVDVGDALSDGNFRPQELALKKGMLHAQQYVVDEARKAYQQAGAVVRKPVLEVLVGGTMRFMKITDDGGENEINIGDVIPEQKFEMMVKRNSRIKGLPEVPGIGSKPLLSNDLMERLNFQRLEDAVREVPAMAGSSDLTGQGSPLPGLAYGVAFRPGQEAFNLKEK